MSMTRSLGLIGLCVLAGCGSAEPALPLVSGTVLLDGKPLAGAHIRFIPQGETLGHGGTGNTGVEGKYEITSRRSNNRKGLLPGEYKVIVSRLLMPDGSPLPPNVPPQHSGAAESVPEPYCNAQTTTLTATIGTKGNVVDFRLTKKK